MKRTVYFIAVIVCALVWFACESDKTYQGPVQIAFAAKTAQFTLDKDSTLIIPVQLIAGAPQEDIVGKIQVDTVSNCTAAVNVPVSVKIPSGRFIGELPIAVKHSQLATGNVNKLVLNLSSDVKVAANYSRITLILNKK